MYFRCRDGICGLRAFELSQRIAIARVHQGAAHPYRLARSASVCRHAMRRSNPSITNAIGVGDKVTRDHRDAIAVALGGALRNSFQ